MSLTQQQTEIAGRILASLMAGNDNNDGMPQPLAQLMVDQSAHETNGWTSDFFVNNNNCFGYECDSKSIWQDGCSTNNADNGATVGNYDTIENSCQELVDWIWRRVEDGKFPSDLTTITSADQYATLLKGSGYYGDTESNYLAGLQRWGSQLVTFFKRP